jgi:hypothetical protein
MTDEPGIRLRVTGTRRYDGEYPLDLDRALTTREWHWIKRLSGYMPATMGEGLAGNDPSLYLAFTVVAMVRAGKVDKADALDAAETLMDQPFEDTISMVGEAEDDAGPPDLTSADEGSSPNGTRSKQQPSGVPSTPSSAPSDVTPEPTGTIGSDMSVMSGRTERVS